MASYGYAPVACIVNQNSTILSDTTINLPNRAHNPLLIATGFPQTDTTVPRIEEKRLQFSFGS